MLTEVRTSIQSGNCGEQFGEGEEDAAVQETGYVCDEDLLGYVPPGVTEGFEDAAGLRDGEGEFRS